MKAFHGYDRQCAPPNYHGDHLGSAQVVTNGVGEIYEHIEYTPYGELWVDHTKRIGSEEGTPFRFTGKEYDEETGLYYYGARYLDPRTSRWISTDPAMGEYIPGAPINDEAKKHNKNLPGMGGVFNYVNLHVYHYAGNNPIALKDPDGEIIESGWDIASLVIGFGNLAVSIHEGDVGGIIIDAVGLAADLVATALPGVPGGAGAAIKAVRSAAKITSDVAGVAGGLYSANKAAQEGDSLGVGLGIASAATPALGRVADTVFDKAADANRAAKNLSSSRWGRTANNLTAAGNIVEGTATGINATKLGREMHQSFGNQQTPISNRTGSSSGLNYGPGTGRSSPPPGQSRVVAPPVIRSTSPVMN